MTHPIRARAEALLAGTGAFLRRDRGGALYATNLPAKQKDWEAVAAKLEAEGFAVSKSGALLFLAPTLRLADEFARWAEKDAIQSELTRQLSKRRGLPVCEAEEACFIAGLKQMELNDRGDYEKRLRQTAAVALREKRGGLLYACGLCLDLMGGNEL